MGTVSAKKGPVDGCKGLFIVILLLVASSAWAQLPCQSPVSLTFDASSPQTCAQSPVSYTLDVTGATSATLTSTGSGTFSQQLIEARVIVSYTPSAADMLLSTITFTFQSDDPDRTGVCLAKQLAQQLTISPPTPCLPISAALIYR
ncbi:hypothetical protein [Fibrella forsythiae]|uniref:Uncharacterized protein n=1 Tax=Fibrella forsythiae TaxID=2817061 RepID=A0ABS3JEN7_9BACT|nr:hypothetical protein [Fibrella forsythiae]MBO0948446.1 hypothetical protein [Fibrella forsythiae]